MYIPCGWVRWGPSVRPTVCPHSLLDEVRQGMELGKLAVAAADEALGGGCGWKRDGVLALESQIVRDDCIRFSHSCCDA